MSTPEGEKKIPEWSIFDRLDELEDITLKLMEKTDVTEPTLEETSVVARDAKILADYALTISFGLAIAGHSNPREGKDILLKLLKDAGLSKEMLVSEAKLLLQVCEAKERREKGVK